MSRETHAMAVGGTVDFLIRTSGDSPATEQLHGLWQWLGVTGRRDQYRVEGQYCPPREGTLGPVLDALSVAVASGGAITVLVSGVIEWIRHGRADKHPTVPLAITVKQANGAEITIDTQIAQAWSAAELTDQVRRMVALLHPTPPKDLE